MIASETATFIDLPALIRLQADARALRLPSARQVRRVQAGMQASPRRGRGMAFAEVRPYQPGDDIRSIDWRVTARRQTPHTKLYEEERERPVLMVCDLNRSHFFSSTGAYKQVRSAQVTALLAWLALAAGDQVSGIVFNEQDIVVQRPARRKKSVLRLLDYLAHYQHRPDTRLTGDSRPERARIHLDTALQETLRVSHTGARIFVISDFLDLSDDTAGLLANVAQHNSVTAIRVTDPLEHRLPEKGWFAVTGPDGPIWFNASDRRFQEAFAARVAKHETALTQCFQRSGVECQTLATDAEPVRFLQSLLGPRGRIG
ncbi:MAG: DUF58 domain-containing protein [Pseudomonadales bacterium]|nr:DUF58 domain-containing protein [Pseudomonadales bacterium]